MGISEAIARVRRSATRSSLIDGALSYLGVRIRSDLGARLNSRAVPAPLRPLASRLATLIASVPPPYDDAAARQLEIVSLDRALVQAAQRSATAAHAPSDMHAGGDVCPFTGLRADGSLAEVPAAANSQGGSPATIAEASSVAVPLQNELLQSEPSPSKPLQSEHPPAQPVEARLPIPTAENDASSVVATTQAPAAEAAAVKQTAKKPAAKRTDSQPPAKSGGEKRKEKLAASEDVTNTSARSATRPAAKQPSGKGQTSSRKRRDSGL
jgi:hypothetical protein